MADLTQIRSPGGASFWVDRSHGPRFSAFLTDLENSGYGIKGNQSGGYNYRNIAGTNKLSNHAHGSAIDINWTDNPRGGTSSIPPELARSLAQKHGLTWGGDWKNPDAMHFEVPGSDHSHGAPLPGRMALGGPSPSAEGSSMATPYTGMSPEDVAYQRKYAQGLMQQGTDASPVGHWTQALARALQGGVGGYAMGQAGQAEQQGRGSANAILAQALQGGDPKASIGAMLGNPWSADTGTKLAQSYIGNQLQPQTTDDIKEFEYAKKSGNSGTFTDWMKSKREPVQRPPAGYRPTPDGNMEAIPGGPADVKTNEKRQQDFATVQQLTQSLDGLQRAAYEVLKHPGLGGNFGVSGAFPNIPGGNSANAAALLDTLKTKAAFATLQDMRNASKTGGALGAVSDRENMMLQNAIAALGKSQSVDQVKKQLEQIIGEVDRSKARIHDAYNDHWNKGGVAAKQEMRPNQAPAPQAAPAGPVQPGNYVWTPDGGVQPSGGR